jgi:hypothetical protein
MLPYKASAENRFNEKAIELAVVKLKHKDL